MKKAAKAPAKGATETTAKSSSKKGVLIGAVVLAVVIIVAAIAYNALAPNASSTIREEQTTSFDGASDAANQQDGSEDAQTVPAPDFTMQDAEGNDVSLSSLFGKPMVLNFWASTCGPCQREMPEFQAAFEEMGDEVRFTMVDIPGFNGESVQRAKQFVADNGYTFPVFFDVDGEASVPYGLSSIPRTYFLDAQGNVVASAAGMLDAQTLQQGLSMIR